MNIVICDTAGDEVTVPYVICDDGQLCSSLPLTATDLLVSTAATEVTASEVGTTLSRKRKRNFSSWKKNKRKHLRNSGQQYVSSAGRVVSAKKFAGLKDKCCHKKCTHQFTTSEPEQIFTNFWHIGNYDAQNLFIAGCIEQRSVSSHIVPSVGTKRVVRSYARRFTVQTGNGHVAVCKRTFLSLLVISAGRINTVLRSQRMNGGVALADRRGKYDHAKQRIATERITFIEDHIRSFPVNESHYTRAHSESRQYLSANLNIRKMYDLYVERCGNMKQEPVKYWCYREVFNTRFNLSFHQPRKDTCKQCDVFKAQTGSERDQVKASEIKSQHELHLRKAEMVRSNMQSHKDIGLTEPDSDAFTFDLQKVFSVPYISANEAYYCRQLSVYNLGVHSLSSGQAVMNVWDETIASRGAEEIASCLLKYCKEKALAGVTSLQAYSDACGVKTEITRLFLCGCTYA